MGNAAARPRGGCAIRAREGIQARGHRRKQCQWTAVNVLPGPGGERRRTQEMVGIDELHHSAGRWPPPKQSHTRAFRHVLEKARSAIINEATGRRDPSLDMFNPENWIAGNPKTSEGVRYSPQFLAKYYKAQSVRLNRLIDVVEEKRKIVESGKGRFNDDDMIVVTGTYAKPCYLDVSLCGTTNPALKVDSAYGAAGLGDRPVRNTSKGNLSIREASIHSYRAFLSFRAIRSTDPYTGLDYSTSNAVTPYHIARVSAPILFLISTGDEQVSPADLDENSKPIKKGVDVSRFFVKGANHGYTKPEWKQVAAKGALAWLDSKFPDS